MGMGIGKKYLAKIVKWKYGTLKECISFINENIPKNSKQFFSLEGIPNLKTKTLEIYRVTILEL